MFWSKNRYTPGYPSQVGFKGVYIARTCLLMKRFAYTPWTIKFARTPCTLKRQVDNDQEKAQSERNSHSETRGEKKLN